MKPKTFNVWYEPYILRSVKSLELSRRVVGVEVEAHLGLLSCDCTQQVGRVTERRYCLSRSFDVIFHQFAGSPQLCPPVSFGSIFIIIVNVLAAM